MKIENIPKIDNINYVPIFWDIETTGLSAYDSKVHTYAFKVYGHEPDVVFNDDEDELIKGMLDKFMDLRRKYENSVFIGYNIYNFDLKFVVSRALKYGIFPKVLGYVKFIDMYYVVMNMFRSRQSASKVAKKFGIENDDEYTGKDTLWMYNAKRYDLIKMHCKKDVELLEKMFGKVRGLVDYEYWRRYILRGGD